MEEHKCSKCAVTFGNLNAPVATHYYLSKLFNITVYLCKEHAFQTKKVSPQIHIHDI
jgi:hypothetical protein